MTSQDVITNAFIEAGLYAPGEALSADDAAFGLNKLNRLNDNWNTESLYIFGTTLTEFQLTPNHNPHTIGLAAQTPDFTVTTSRPPRIDVANLVLTDQSPVIYRPLKIVDDAWWMANPVPSLATQIPYYLYPNYGWPLGQIYLWPVPTVAYKLRLNLWNLFSSFALTDTFTLPPGYEDAVTLSLAETLTSTFGKSPSPVLVQQAALARGRVKSQNSEAPEMRADGGVQSMDQRPSASIANILSGFLS
jgi:hypothetical protein